MTGHGSSTGGITTGMSLNFTILLQWVRNKWESRGDGYYRGFGVGFT